MPYEVEAGVAMPSRIATRKYPLEHMEVGDSFDAGEADAKTKSRIGSAVYTYGKKHGLSFSIRQTTDGHLRVWRVG